MPTQTPIFLLKYLFQSLIKITISFSERIWYNHRVFAVPIKVGVVLTAN